MAMQSKSRPYLERRQDIGKYTGLHVTTTHEKFKVVKLEGIDQYGNDIKVNVYLDEKQTVKKVAEYSFSHPKHKKTA